MLHNQFEDIDAALLRAVCAEKWGESTSLEFKRELPSSNDRGRDEFLKDVCALANTEGGDIVFGIDEIDGKASSIFPINDAAPDETCRRLGQILEAVEPRISGIQFRDLAVDGGYVLVLRVPSSFDGPHRYLVNSRSRFPIRNQTHVGEMTYDQLRNAFDRSATLADRAKQFCESRQNEIMQGRTWRPFIPGPLAMLHLVPLSSMSGRKHVPIQDVYKDYSSLLFPEWRGGNRLLNLDGLLVRASIQDDGEYAYTQLFRTGAMEAVQFAGLTVSDKKIIPSYTLADFLPRSDSAIPWYS
jgi:hypothetical protein